MRIGLSLHGSKAWLYIVIKKNNYESQVNVEIAFTQVNLISRLQDKLTKIMLINLSTLLDNNSLIIIGLPLMTPIFRLSMQIKLVFLFDVNLSKCRSMLLVMSG